MTPPIAKIRCTIGHLPVSWRWSHSLSLPGTQPTVHASDDVAHGLYTRVCKLISRTNDCPSNTINISAKKYSPWFRWRNNCLNVSAFSFLFLNIAKRAHSRFIICTMFLAIAVEYSECQPSTDLGRSSGGLSKHWGWSGQHPQSWGEQRAADLHHVSRVLFEYWTRTSREKLEYVVYWNSEDKVSKLDIFNYDRNGVMWILCDLRYKFTLWCALSTGLLRHSHRVDGFVSYQSLK